ncbi:MAG: hypothetical protein DRN81_04770 [Thermoproteota archaeon]|nr:MAG: hypothetical protein DRN81_04770 [Candidatus Korarchaeota archaeon]
MADNAEKKDLIQKEMTRRSNDEIKVHNPTNEDYYITWGGLHWVVPNKNKDTGQGRGNSVLPRYLAAHYVKHHTDKLILKESKAIVEKAKKEYKGTRWPEEELRVALRTSNPELRKKYIKKMWLGVHRRFGLDEIPGYSRGEELKPKDRRPIDEQLIDDLENESPETIEVENKDNPTMISPEEKNKEAFVKAVSNG